LIGNVSEISSICIDGPVINSLITGKHVAITPQIELDAIWLQFSLHVTSARLLAKSFKLVSAHTRGRLPPTPVATAEHSVKPIFASMERAIFRTLSSRVAFTASLDCGSSSQGACKVRFDQLCSECRCRNTSRCWRYDGRLDLSKFALTYLYQLLILLGLGAICLVGHGRQLD